MNTITHAFYINLESRPDRKLNVEQELLKVGIKAQRFNAIRLPNGAIGCSMSHLKCLETAKQNNWDHVCIVEDDIQFLNPVFFVQQCKRVLTQKFDVVLLAGNNVPPYTRVDDSCVKVSRCQTTTGYIVKQHYYDTLIANIKEGIGKLLREPEKHVLYAIDKYWFQLQEIDTWLLVTPLTVTQREDYSDIENRHTNYTRAMIDLDKVEFFKAQREAHEKYMLTQMKFPE
jgi:GR25 family glycosyltransferase involved in LPS biosynthesis